MEKELLERSIELEKTSENAISRFYIDYHNVMKDHEFNFVEMCLNSAKENAQMTQKYIREQQKSKRLLFIVFLLVLLNFSCYVILK